MFAHSVQRSHEYSYTVGPSEYVSTTLELKEIKPFIDHQRHFYNFPVLESESLRWRSLNWILLF